MVGVELYNASSTLLFNFYPEPTWQIQVGKQMDFDEIPFQRRPDAYDPISQNVSISVTGTLTPLASALTVSGTNESVRERMNLMRGFSIYKTDGTIDSSSLTEILYKLRIYFPDALGYDAQDYQEFNVVIMGMTFDGSQNPLNPVYTITFREADTVTIT